MRGRGKVHIEEAGGRAAWGWVRGRYLQIYTVQELVAELGGYSGTWRSPTGEGVRVSLKAFRKSAPETRLLLEFTPPPEGW